MTKPVAVVLTAVAAAAAGATAFAGFAYGTYAAGGSDSSCYALMAQAFAGGAWQPASPLALQVPWPDAAKTFAPGGFVPSASNPAAAAPVCAPGFSLLLAAAMKVGGADAVFAVTPVAGALLVWLAFIAARGLAGPAAGAIAAVLTASSPIVLFQVVQPMNDVTTAMLWMAVFAALITRRWAVAGACCGLALLVRPNLLPLGIVAALYAVTTSRHRNAAVATFAAWALPFLLAVLWMNRALYGSPWRSGYGAVGTLFSTRNVWVNAPRYLQWLIQTQTVAAGLGLLAPLLVDARGRAAVWLALALIAGTVAIYLAYTPFDDWSYLRFLLPAIALLVVLTSVVVVRVAAFAGERAGCAAAALLAAWLAFHGVTVARERLAFQLNALERRYRSAGLAVRDRLPADAVILSTWDSGAVRFHGGKEAVVWDALDPAWLDRGVAWLSTHGHRPFIMVESWEEPRFRARFGGASPLGMLDWPPAYEVDRVVRIYDPADRGRHLRGEQVMTQYLWPGRRRVGP